MPSSILVRPARLADAGAITAFNLAMARETEDLALDETTLRAGVEAVFADSARGAYWIVERGGRPAGCLLITTEWSDWRNGCFWWIQSVYVDPEDRGSGVYRALYTAVLAAARQTSDVCGVRLYVERENQRARAIYAHLGMDETPYRLLEVDFVLRR